MHFKPHSYFIHTNKSLRCRPQPTTHTPGL